MRNMMTYKSPTLWFTILIVITAIFTSLGPPEATLGTNARVVYLHGAWVWASLAAFILAGCVGLAGLLRRLTGKMDANWNGLFLAEPRWRFAMIFAITGLLLQIGLSFTPVGWASFWNVAFVATLFGVLRSTENVMHPPSPMLDSNAWRIQLFFGGLTLLLLITAWQVARWFRSLEGRLPGQTIS
jgi:hypothetical protein